MSINLYHVLRQMPYAATEIIGSADYPGIKGDVRFYQTEAGVIVAAEIYGLPETESEIYGFHIHSGSGCSGNASDPFADALTHYNPSGSPHPYHEGDLSPLFGNDGYALSLFLTDRFDVYEIIGKTVVIHSSPDDFTSQPSGNSGTKIACGEIERKWT